MQPLYTTPIRNPYTSTLDPYTLRIIVPGLDPYTLYPRPLYANPSTPRRFTLDPLRTGLNCRFFSMMRNEGPEALVAMEFAVIICQHHLYMA